MELILMHFSAALIFDGASSRKSRHDRVPLHFISQAVESAEGGI